MTEQPGDGGKADDANGGAGSSFDPNRLIADAAMLDSSVFSAAEIDAFLADPYEDGQPSCLAKESFGGRSAGDLIRQAATQYQLNPLFLLTHLQKESSLVGQLGTCSQVAMDEAFGCGCPDGSGCAPQFSGFANQIDCAGELTRSYLDDLGAGQSTVSGWSVGKAKSTLDPVSITPANAATAVLYTYTPWVGDKNAGGNAAPFGNYLFWQVWVQYAGTLGYTVSGGGAPPTPPSEPTPPSNPGGALSDWTYILDTDVGLRSDGLGEGYFQAPRGGGRLHNGLDILGSPGEPIYAPCSGEALSGSSGSFGNWVQLVCPVSIAGQEVWASMLYAHLDSREVGFGGFHNVSKDTRVGRLGSTGNAAGTNPHVHYEIIFHASRVDALNEFHSGNDISNNATSDEVLALMQEHCLEPNGLNSVDPTDIIRYGRRFDPYLALTCLGANKAALQSPPASLQSAVVPWSRWYQASTFDVDSEHL
ncbi:MAG: M23 family metallopeptidase [Deltaproteobacteria bacterium]|nr:M23 family metallopeptidase [Deltaproteobacteria bacterium]